MKSKMLLLAALAGSLATPAFAQSVDLVVTGSTAFRSIVYDRIQSLYDTGYSRTRSTDDAAGANYTTYSGTMTAAVDGTTTINIYCSFSGSASGMLAVQNGTAVKCPPVGDTTPADRTSKAPNVAFSDVFPGSANPAIPSSAFDVNTNVGVIPFVFITKSDNGITGITRDQALMLMVDGGIMPQTFLGGSSSAPAWMVGRDSGSGTRICTEKCIGFVGQPFLFQRNAANTAWESSSGYTSGGNLRGSVSTNSGAIGYVGLSDFNAVSNTCRALTYNGVPYTSDNVRGGKYGIWGYEHLVAKGLSGNQVTVLNALIAALTDRTYQTTNPTYTGAAESIQDMQVYRNADGATMGSTSF